MGMPSRILHRGAEAVLSQGERDQQDVVIKDRICKAYRLPPLDSAIRIRRTRMEARLLDMARRHGLPVPRVIAVENTLLSLEPLGGLTLKDALLSLHADRRAHLHAQLGALIARLHCAGIIHGDLTTSNIILSGDRLWLIDFGLGKMSRKPDDQAMDLYVLYETWPLPAERAEVWQNVLKAYAPNNPQSPLIFRTIEKIAKRRRYR